MEAFKDASRLYQVKRRALHSERIFLREPSDNLTSVQRDAFSVVAGRPHFVKNDGDTSVLILQGGGEYDYVPLD